MQKEIEFIESKINKDTVLIVASFMIALVGLMMPLDNDFTLRVGAFLLVSGSLFAIIKSYFLIQHERIKNKFYDHAIEVSEVQNGLRPTVKDEIKRPESVSSQSHIVYLDKVDDDGQHQTDLRRFNPANKPPKEFIVACHGLAVRSEKNRVTEREVIKWLPSKKNEQDKWDRWNVWLDEMEKVGILKPEDNRAHAARYWDIEHIQLDTALEIFEYEPILPPTQMVTLPGSTRGTPDARTHDS